MIEKRKHIRYLSRLLMTTFLRDSEDQIVGKNAIYSEDVSADGLRIIYPQHLAKEAMIQLKLYLFSDPIPVFVKGKIIWSQIINDSQETFKGNENNYDNEDREGKEENSFCRAGMELINIRSFERERILRWIKNELALVHV